MLRYNLKVTINGDLRKTDERFSVSHPMRQAAENGDEYDARDIMGDRVTVLIGGVPYAFDIDDVSITDIMKPRMENEDE